MKKAVIICSMFILIPGVCSYGNDNTDKVTNEYEEYCASCHNGGFKGWITGAPKIGKLKKWKPFFDTGLDEMTKNVMTGEKKHEIKGGCETCTEADIRAINKYIMSVTK